MDRVYRIRWDGWLAGSHIQVRAWDDEDPAQCKACIGGLWWCQVKWFHKGHDCIESAPCLGPFKSIQSNDRLRKHSWYWLHSTSSQGFVTPKIESPIFSTLSDVRKSLYKHSTFSRCSLASADRRQCPQSHVLICLGAWGDWVVHRILEGPNLFRCAALLADSRPSEIWWG